MNRRRHKLSVEERFPYIHVGGSQDGQRFKWVDGIEPSSIVAGPPMGGGKYCELYRLDGTRYVFDGYAELVRGTT